MERTDVTDRYAALRSALAAGPTPGPWRWEFNKEHKAEQIGRQGKEKDR